MKFKILAVMLFVASAAQAASWSKSSERWYYDTGEIGIGYLQSIGNDITTQHASNYIINARSDMWRRQHLGLEAMIGTGSFKSLSSSRKTEVFGELRLKVGLNVASEEKPFFIDLVVSGSGGANAGNATATERWNVFYTGGGAEIGGKAPIGENFAAYNLGYEYLFNAGYTVNNANDRDNDYRSSINGGHLIRASLAYHKVFGTSGISAYLRLSARYLMLNQSNPVMIDGVEFSRPSRNNLSAMAEIGFGF